MQTNIVPVQVFPYTATSIKLGVAHIQKFGSGGDASVSWHMLDSSGMIIQTGVVGINVDEYDNWGNDDTYILNLVVSKLGLTAVP